MTSSFREVGGPLLPFPPSCSLSALNTCFVHAEQRISPAEDGATLGSVFTKGATDAAVCMVSPLGTGAVAQRGRAAGPLVEVPPRSSHDPSATDAWLPVAHPRRVCS